MKRLLFLVFATGCAGSGPDCPADECAEVCVDTATDVANCGACGQTCSPAAACAEAACACPANFMPEAPVFTREIVRADVAQLPGLTTGVGLITADDARLHALLVAFDPETVPVGVDLDLATADPTVVRIGMGYEVDPLNTIRGAYLATSGTLRLDAACAGGVAGVLTGIGTVEVDIFAGFAPIVGGCTLAAPSVVFAIGECAP